MGCNTSAPIIIKQVPTSPVLLQELRPIKSSVFISQAKGQITDFFEIIKALDTPGTCPLFHAKEVHTGTYRTIKEISKHLITESGQVYQEYKILSDIDHPNIEKIYKTIETPRSFYIVYESIQGGTIKSRVKKIGDESTVSKYFVDILSALNYLHNLEVIHCNINLDNIMMSDGSPEAIVKLTDFSFSQKKAEIQEIDLKLIAHEFTSPEMLQGKFDTQTDMWSIGILLYWLLVGRLPYEPTDKPGLIESVYYGKIEKECQAYNVLTNNAKDLISKLLVVDPLERLTAQQVLQHDWVKHGKAEGKLSFAIIHKMRSFKIRTNIARSMITYFTFKMNIADSEAVSFFKRIDDNFDGKVSQEEIIEAFSQVGINVASEIDSIMNNLDIDMSGYLDYTELKIVLADWTKEIKKKTLAKCFEAKENHVSLSFLKTELIGILNSEWVEFIKKTASDGNSVPLAKLKKYILANIN